MDRVEKEKMENQAALEGGDERREEYQQVTHLEGLDEQGTTRKKIFMPGLMDRQMRKMELRCHTAELKDLQK